MEPFYKILHYQFAKKSRCLEKRNNHTGKERNNSLTKYYNTRYADIRYEKLSTQYHIEKGKNNLINKMKAVKQDTKSDKQEILSFMLPYTRGNSEKDIKILKDGSTLRENELIP